MKSAFRDGLRWHQDGAVASMAAMLCMFGFRMVTDPTITTTFEYLAIWLASVLLTGAVSGLLWVAFAVTYALRAHRREQEEATARQAQADRSAHFRASHQNGIDVMSCDGPCPNRYNCLMGVCVQAATRRFVESPRSPAPRNGGTEE